VDVRYSIQDIDNMIADLEAHIGLKQEEIKMWKQRKKQVEDKLVQNV